MRLISFLFAITLSISLTAQRNSRMANDSISDWSITFSPSAFVNEFSGIQFGLEKRFNERWATELEFAYIFPQVISPTDDEVQKEGYRAKLGVKRQLHNRIHIVLTMYYRRTVHDFRSNFSRFNGQFNQIMDYQVTKTLLGPTCGMLWELPLTKRLSTEMGASTGVGYYSRKRSELPDDVFIVNDSDGFFGLSITGDDWYPILALHLKLKLRLN